MVHYIIYSLACINLQTSINILEYLSVLFLLFPVTDSLFLFLESLEPMSSFSCSVSQQRLNLMGLFVLFPINLSYKKD